MHGVAERFDMSAPPTMGPYLGFALAGAYAPINSTRHQIRIECRPKHRLRKAKARAVAPNTIIGGSGGQLGIVGLLGTSWSSKKRGHSRTKARSCVLALRSGDCYETIGSWAESINTTGSCLLLESDHDYNTSNERDIFHHRLAFFFSGPFSSPSLSSA